MNCSPTTAKTGRGDTRVLALTSVASPRLIPKEVVGANVTARSGFRARARLSTVVLVGEVRDVDPKREALEELAEDDRVDERRCMQGATVNISAQLGNERGTH